MNISSPIKENFLNEDIMHSFQKFIDVSFLTILPLQKQGIEISCESAVDYGTASMFGLPLTFFDILTDFPSPNIGNLGMISSRPSTHGLAQFFTGALHSDATLPDHKRKITSCLSAAERCTHVH